VREPGARTETRFVDALARRRVTLGFVFGVVVLWLAQPTGRTLVAGSSIAFSGEALRIWAAGHLYKSSEVTMSGPYRWFAHPLYIGSALMGAGLALASGSLVVAVLVAIYLTATLTAAVKTEEAFLRRTFGEKYDRYRRSSDLASISGRRFSLARAFANHEHRAALGLAAAVLLLVLKATYNGVLWR
jgi:F0F1-type ATP synthase membrane subunit c/vacuolar-type H+-ATPase subunit K